MNVNYNSNMYSIIIIILIISIIIISCVTIVIIVSEILTFSPSFILLLLLGVHPCQIPDHLGLESVAFDCGPPALPSSFFWQPCSQLHLGSQKTRPDAVPVPTCMSDVLPALCHSPFLTTLSLLTFFLVSIFPVVLFLIEQ